MFTAGINPACDVRWTCWQKPSQSMCPSSEKGSKMAEMPVIVRRGLSIAHGLTTDSGSNIDILGIRHEFSLGAEVGNITGEGILVVLADEGFNPVRVSGLQCFRNFFLFFLTVFDSQLKHPF